MLLSFGDGDNFIGPMLFIITPISYSLLPKVRHGN